MKPIVVAIIDDDQLYHLQVKIRLSTLSPSSQLLSFINGKEGFEFLVSNTSDKTLLPDCVFLDLEMPVMNGWEFLQKFREIKDELEKDIAIYIFSSLPDIQEKLLNYPFLSGRIAKPFDTQELKDILKNLINN